MLVKFDPRSKFDALADALGRYVRKAVAECSSKAVCRLPLCMW